MNLRHYLLKAMGSDAGAKNGGALGAHCCWSATDRLSNPSNTAAVNDSMETADWPKANLFVITCLLRLLDREPRSGGLQALIAGSRCLVQLNQ